MLDGYIIGKRIGSGSYGNVYLVTSKEDGKTYAMKKISVYNIKHKEKVYIISEILIQKSHKCNYIIKLFDVFYHSNYIYIISEYASNGDLDRYIKQAIKDRKRIPDTIIAKWILQLASALKYLHRNNIIHRDIKTSNIFLDNEWNIKLGDLGISKIMGNDFNLANTYIGTPYYMAPELYSGLKYNTKCDIWSFGCIIYELITLRKPFDGRNIIELAKKIKYSSVNSNYIIRYKSEYMSILNKMLISDFNNRCCIDYIYCNRFLENIAKESFNIDKNYLNKTNKNLRLLPKMNLYNNWSNLIDDINRNYINETIFYKSPRINISNMKSLDDSVIIEKKKHNLLPLDDSQLLDKYRDQIRSNLKKDRVEISEEPKFKKNILPPISKAPKVNYVSKIDNKINPYSRQNIRIKSPIMSGNRNRRYSKYNKYHLRPLKNNYNDRNNTPQRKTPERSKSNLEVRNRKIQQPSSYYERLANFKNNYVSPYRSPYIAQRNYQNYNSDAIKAIFNYGY